jgi:WD40 repeat protein/ribosomal protein S27E
MFNLDLQAEQIPNNPNPASAESEAEQEPKKRSWLIVAGLIVLLIGGSFATMIALWLFLRSRLRVRAPVVTDKGPQAPPLSFNCGECNRKLRVKAESAGKRIKCPHCGEITPAPHPTAAASARGKTSWAPLLLTPLVVLGLGLVAYGLTRSAVIDEAADESAPAVRRLQGHTGPVHNIRFTRDGRLISASGWPESDQTVRIWDVKAGRQIKRINTDGAIHSLDLSPDEKTALVGLNNGKVHVLDLNDGRVSKTHQIHKWAVGWIAFAPDGKHAASTSDEGTARHWALADGKQLARMTVASKQARAGVLLPDGKRLLTGDGRGNLQIWDLENGAEVKQIEMGNPSMIDAILLTPDGKQAIVAGAAGTRLHDLATGAEIRKFQEEHEEHHGVALSPDGRWLLTGGFDCKVRLWDFKTGELVRTLGSHDGFVFTVAFSPDGKFAVSGGGGEKRGDKFVAGADHEIRIWNLSFLAGGASPAPERLSQRWLAVPGAVIVFLTLLGMGAWFVVSWIRARSAKVARGGELQGPAHSIAVTCASCRKNVRISTDAGKKPKCPKCGAVIKPSTAISG